MDQQWRDRPVCLALIVALQDLERLYARDHAHYPQEIVVLAGRELFAAIARADGEFMWRFEPLPGELVTPGLRSRVTVIGCHDPELPVWGYRAVPGIPASAELAPPQQEQAVEHAG